VTPTGSQTNAVAALEFLGHAAVRLTASDGTRLVIDPFVAGGFGGKIGYASIEEPAEFVWATHQHADHAAYDQVPGDPAVIQEPGRYGPFKLQTWTLAHDEYGGRRRGGMVDVTRVDVDGRSVVHLSDVGQSVPGRVPDAFRRPDVLLATCGGYYTIGAAQAWEWSARMGARVTIPIHYKTSRCGLPIRSREPFLAHWLCPREAVGERIELGAELFSFQRDVVSMTQKL
jgi:L-ascorbate metabolism protein UlaG (beta-lactamase superfamily)